MASATATALTMAMASPALPHKKALAGSPALRAPGALAGTRKSSSFVVRASSKPNSVREHAAAGIAAAALAAALVIPEIAEAAQPGVSPSLKNFLLSIASGGVVVVVIVGAVIAVSNFDPVKRS